MAMKRILTLIIWAAALLAPAALATSCDDTGKIEVVSKDFAYQVSVEDVSEGTAAECVIALVKGGGREEAITVDYRIDDDPSLRVRLNGAELAPGSSVALDATGKARVALPVLPAGRHSVHLALTNQYGLSVEKDVSFSVIHEKVWARAVKAPAALRLETGSPLDTTVSVDPADADDLALAMTVGDASVARASLSGDGAVKALHVEPVAPGTTSLELFHGDIQGAAAAVAVEVFSYRITGLPEAMDMTEGATATLALDVQPAADVTLTSSSSCVVLTPSAGLAWELRAASPGEALLTAAAGNARATCRVTVSKKPETIAISPMSATIASGKTKFFSVVSSADFNAEVSGSGASVTERTSTGVTVRNENEAFEDVRATLTVINAADPSKRAVADLLLERRAETLSLTETLSESGRAVWSVSGENRGWELVSAPAGLKTEVSGSSIVLTNATYKSVSGELKVRTKLQGVEASHAVTVAGMDVVLEALAADPSSFSVEVGRSVSLALAGTWSDGTSRDVTGEATWTQSQNLARNGNSFTATEAGSAWIRASYGGRTVTVDGTVTPKPVKLSSVDIDPSQFSALVDESRVFSVVASLSDGTRRDVTRDCEWTATGGAQELGKGYYKMTDVGEVLIEASYTYEGTTMSARSRGTVTRPSGTVTGVTIDPKNASLMVGDAVTFTGAVRYSDGTTDASGAFSVSPAGILSGGDGSYVAIAEGAATVTYSYSGYSASAAVVVSKGGGGGGGGAAELVSVTLNNTLMTLYVGRGGTLSAVAKYSDGSAADVTQKATWSSSNESVATVSSGRVTALKAGMAVVTADVSGVRGSCTVTVEEEVTLSGISITPSSFSVMEGDGARAVSSKGYWSDGTSRDLTFLGTWSTSDASVATVSGGTVTFGKSGSATITCAYQGKSASASVTVTKRQQVTTRIDLTPPSATLTVGESLQVDGTVYCEYPTETLSARSACTWSSSNASVASVSSTGRVTAQKAGSAIITASHGGKSATCAVTVQAAPVTLSSLRLNASTLSMAVGGTYSLPGDFRATAVFSDGSTRDVTSSLQWSLASNAYVNISGTTLSAVKESGSAKAALTASWTYSGTTRSATVQITVTGGGQGTLLSISVTPSYRDVVAGQTLTPSSSFTVKASYSDGSTKDVTKDCTWEISSQYSSIAYMNGSTVMTRNAGTAVLTVRYQDKEATARINVVAASVPVTGITLSRTSLTLTEGATATLTATVSPANATDTRVTWSSNNTSVATCANGLVTAARAGTCRITAKTADGGYTAYCDVTVTPRGVDVASVSVSPSTAEVETGSRVKLTATVLPSDATNKGVTWSSYPEDVATVSQDANDARVAYVTGVSAGVATIYATSDDNASIYGYCSVNVKAKTVQVTGVKIYDGSSEVSSIEVSTGSPRQLRAEVLPSDATNKGVSWKSSNANVIAVTQSGLVSAKAAGEETVTVTTDDGGFSATVRVKGVQLQYSITADPAAVTWESTDSGSRTVTLTLTNISAITATLKSGTEYFESPALTPVSAGTYRLTVKPKKENASTYTRKGVVRVADANDASHYTDIELEQSGREAPYVRELSVSPSSVTVNEATSASAGTTAELSASATDQYGAGIDPGSVSWHSEDAKTASVRGGVVTGVKAGSTAVWASVVNARGETVESGRVAVTVNKVKVAVTGISVSQPSLTLDPGDEASLTATVSPDDASDKGVSWSSSNASVATVDDQGNIRAVSAGDATITATARGNLDAKATCSVHVRMKVSGVYVSPSSVTLDASNMSATVVATVQPANAENTGVNWSYEGSALSVQRIRTDGNQHTYQISVSASTLEMLQGTLSEEVRFASSEDAQIFGTCAVTVDAGGSDDPSLEGTTSYSVANGGVVEISGTELWNRFAGITYSGSKYNICASGVYQYVTLTVKRGGNLGRVVKADNTFRVYAEDSGTGVMVISVDLSSDGVYALYRHKNGNRELHFGDIEVMVKGPKEVRLKLDNMVMVGSTLNLVRGRFSKRMTVYAVDDDGNDMSLSGQATWTTADEGVMKLGSSASESSLGGSVTGTEAYAFGVAGGSTSMTVSFGGVSTTYDVSVTVTGAEVDYLYSSISTANSTVKVLAVYTDNITENVTEGVLVESCDPNLRLEKQGSGAGCVMKVTMVNKDSEIYRFTLSYKNKSVTFTVTYISRKVMIAQEEL